MLNDKKNQERILQKLGIEKLNAMQGEAKHAIHANKEVILLSPTGTGKTLAFLLPIIQQLQDDLEGVQAMIIVPSRELAIQIEQVARNMGSGYKVNAAYGGRPISKDKYELKHPPSILVGTPGRVADHIRRGTFSVEIVKTIVLDEFDKSLEVGFEAEMKEILESLPNLERKILTSATKEVDMPRFVELENPTTLDYLNQSIKALSIKTIVSPTKDKLKTLVETLNALGNEPGIVFCNFKASIQRVSEFLDKHNIEHGCFYGGMEQQDRERTLIKFRNGTHQLIVATDLAARGLDVPEIKFIMHYHLPQRSQEFTHRNGRTARMKSDGTAYILKWAKEDLPDFIKSSGEVTLEPKSSAAHEKKWGTVLISGGRRDKISKGDIVGLFLKQGKLKPDQIGQIELKQDCSFIAIQQPEIAGAIRNLNNSRLKKKKVRLTQV